jgi:exodeoxyribonuclease V alpha subunit
MTIKLEGGKQVVNHLSVRLAWHDNGWNGKICKNPKDNVYCVGRYSFPGDLIATKRDLDWEEKNSGVHCSELNRIPPC